MPVESPGLINDLNIAWPQDTNEAREGAQHVRLVKDSLQRQFTGLRATGAGGVAVAATDEELNYVQGVTSSIQAQLNALADAIANLPTPPDEFELGDYRTRPVNTTGDARWVLANGAAVSRTTYADYFALVGTTFGAGDGSTTFNLPDARGRVLLGAGTGSGLTARTVGQTGGEEAVALTGANNGPHSHTLGVDLSGTPGGNGTPLSGSSGPDTTFATNSAGSGTPHENMPPFLVAGYVFVKVLNETPS